ncbi:MAG: hypothetical protein WD077_11095 [Bacteroidia bacterium]
MKNFAKVLMCAAVLSFGLSFTSCKKCTNCTIQDSDGNIVTGWDDAEACGSKDEIEDFEANCESISTTTGGGYTCSCD